MDLDAAMRKYSRLVQYVAHRLHRDVPSIEADDLIQDGMLFLVEIWKRSTVKPKLKVALFKRDLLNHLRNKIRDELACRQPADAVVATIDMDMLLARADCSVLSWIYAREFELEVYRLFHGIDQRILDYLIGRDSVLMEPVGRKNRASGEWLSRLSSQLGITRNHLSQKISNIRKTIRETLAA